MIMAMDPGGNSKYPSTAILLADDVCYTNSEPTFNVLGYCLLHYNERQKIFRLFSAYRKLLSAIVIEDFALDPKKAAAQSWSRFEAVKTIERITVYCEQLGLDHLIVMQAPILRLQADRDGSKFREVFPKYNRHLEAAYKHLRYYIFTHKPKTAR